MPHPWLTNGIQNVVLPNDRICRSRRQRASAFFFTLNLRQYLRLSSLPLPGLRFRPLRREPDRAAAINGAWEIVAAQSLFAAPPELLPRNRFADNLARK
jgi:hypothetical protein